jgi:hypothetical protein
MVADSMDCEITDREGTLYLIISLLEVAMLLTFS